MPPVPSPAHSSVASADDLLCELSRAPFDEVQTWWRDLRQTLRLTGLTKRYVALTRKAAARMAGTKKWFMADARRRALGGRHSEWGRRKNAEFDATVKAVQLPAAEQKAFAAFARHLAQFQGPGKPNVARVFLRLIAQVCASEHVDGKNDHFRAKLMLTTFTAMDKSNPIDSFSFQQLALRHRRGLAFTSTDLGVCLTVLSSFLGFSEKNVRTVLNGLRATVKEERKMVEAAEAAAAAADRPRSGSGASGGSLAGSSDDSSDCVDNLEQPRLSNMMKSVSPLPEPDPQH